MFDKRTCSVERERILGFLLIFYITKGGPRARQVRRKLTTVDHIQTCDQTARS